MFFSDSGMASYCVGGGCECVVWVWLHIPFRPTWHGLILLLVQGHLHVVILLIPFVVFGVQVLKCIHASAMYIIHTCQPIQLGNTRSMERLRIFLTLQSKFDPLTLVSSTLGLSVQGRGQPTAESAWERIPVCVCVYSVVCVCVCVCVCLLFAMLNLTRSVDFLMYNSFLNPFLT